MSIHYDDQFSTSLAQRVARSHRATYIAVRLAMDKQRAGIFFLAYSYFRRIDDVVDSDSASVEQKEILLSRQKALVARFYDDLEYADSFSLDEAERFLRSVIQYDREQGNSSLRHPIQDMLTSLEMDVKRRGQIICVNDLRQNQRYRTRAYAEGVLALLRRQLIRGEDNKLYLFAEACDEAHKLRDMLQDIAFGYYNIPLEALRSYDIELSKPASPGFRNYVRTTVHTTRDRLVRSRRALMHESLVLRLACRAYSLRHEMLLNMIEREDYCLRSSYSFGTHELRYLFRPFAHSMKPNAR